MSARRKVTKCNALFCIAEAHPGDDQHVDVTGHTWREPTPDREVIARAYTVRDEEAAWVEASSHPSYWRQP